MESYQQPLRATMKGVIVRPAHEIADRGFVSPTIIRMMNRGWTSVTSTEAYTIAYLLICGDRATSHEQCGAPCPYCFAEMQRQREMQRSDLPFNDEQLRWMCTPCKDHSFHCVHPWCGVAACNRHTADTMDGSGPYCPDHHAEVAAQLEHEVLKLRRGVAVAHTVKFVRSLVLNDNDNAKLAKR